MKENLVKKHSLIISLSFAIVVLGCMIAEDLRNNADIEWGIILAVFIVIGGVSYLVLSKIFETHNDTISKSIREECIKKAEEEIAERMKKENAQKTAVINYSEIDKDNEIANLKRNERYRREFIGNVSHELKTPLFSIQAYIDTLLDGGINDENINITYLTRTAKNVDRLISIVLDLGTISRFEVDGALQLVKENFNLMDIIDEIYNTSLVLAKKKNIEITINNTTKNDVIVYADQKRIYEVINNLVSNSINYGNINGNTTIGVYDIDDKYIVEVKDNGIGISNDNVKHVFERFFRVDKARSKENGGTGLGLAIVKHIIDAHGERINVKSKLGVGTTFSFTLKKATK